MPKMLSVKYYKTTHVIAMLYLYVISVTYANVFYFVSCA
jgi:hypothetical protein